MGSMRLGCGRGQTITNVGCIDVNYSIAASVRRIGNRGDWPRDLRAIGGIGSSSLKYMLGSTNWIEVIGLSSR